MRPALRRLLLLLPLILGLVILAAYLLLDAWLDGAGGRRALEAALAERLGVPVHLQGEFNVMLLPSVGVAGTALVIGEPGDDSEIGRSRDYAVRLALRPLIDKRMVVESFALSDGTFYPERWPASDTSPAGAAAVRLPEVQSLVIENFLLPDDAGDDLRLSFEIRDFVPGLPASFELAVAGYGQWAGELVWTAAPAGIEVAADWSGLLPGAVRLEARARLAERAGSVRAAWQAPPAGVQPAQALEIEFDYYEHANGIRLERVRLQAGAQAVTGSGCLVLQDARALNLELEAPIIDLDALPDLAPLLDAVGGDAADAPEPGATVGGASAEAGFGLNLRLAAGEARGDGVLAHDAWVSLGADPDCSPLEEPSAPPDP